MSYYFIAGFSISLYMLSSGLIVRHFTQKTTQHVPLYLACLAVVGHLLYIVLGCVEQQGFSFSFVATSSFVSMIVALLLLLAAITKPVAKLGVAVFPIAALMLSLTMSFDDSTQPMPVYHWTMASHILTSIIAFSLLNIAALQAALLAFQDQQLKSHPPKRFVHALPSLQAMEALLFEMLAAGLFFLTLSLGTGFIFLEDVFAQHLVHKTLLSLLAWFIFAGLLLGRKCYGWRGKLAIQWTVFGFFLLLLGYFGSKFVLKLILHR